MLDLFEKTQKIWKIVSAEGELDLPDFIESFSQNRIKRIRVI